MPLAALLAAAILAAVETRSDPPLAVKPAKHEQEARKQPVPAREIAAFLAREQLPRPGSTPKNRIKDVLQSVSDILTKKCHGEVACLVDINAFKAESEEVTSEGLLGEEADLSGLPMPLTLAAALRDALRQLPTRNATYLVRRSCVEVTTLDRASVRGLLERKVLCVFDKCPLEEALHELSDLTGASIVVDPRIRAKSRAPVTATFLNDASLGGALRLLANMAGLQVVIVENVVYVTNPANARRLRQEQDQPLVPPVPQLVLPGAG
jgi:hypothetical protein